MGNLGGGGVLGVHAATTEGALLGLDVFREVTTRSHLSNQFCTGVIGMGGEDAVNVREKNQRVGFHHLSDEAGELVVIGKHQLGDGDSIVLVDDG